MMKNLLIVAGETSGDLHGSSLVKAIKSVNKDIHIAGLGGKKMKAEGVEILWDPTSHATVGLTEVLNNLSRYASAYRKIIGFINNKKPQAAVLLDLPDFNLRLAEDLHRRGIPVIYYISPQIWAWRSGRINKIRRVVTKMLVIFDFEEEIYRKAGVDVTFVGHPLLDVIDFNKPEPDGLRIGLLPASRKEQFHKLFPIISRSAELILKKIPEVKFTVALAPGIDPRLARHNGLEDIVQGKSHEVIKNSTLIITASGTATVEALLFETPMIVTYKVSPLSAIAGRRLIKVKHYAMVNIIAGREVVPELFQEKAKPEIIADYAIKLLNGDGLGKMKEELSNLKTRLGTPGASNRAAAEIIKYL